MTRLNIARYQGALRLLAATAFLFVSAMPASAAQSATESYMQCAVGIIPSVVGYGGNGPPPEIRAYSSPGDEASLSSVGAICSTIIQSGNWFGMSKYGQWRIANGGLFRAACHVSWPDPIALDIYYAPGAYEVALDDCRYLDRQVDSRVTYF